MAEAQNGGGQMAETRGSDQTLTPAASGDTADDTIEYEDPDETKEYKEMMATFKTYHDDLQEAKDTYHINKKGFPIKPSE